MRDEPIIPLDEDKEVVQWFCMLEDFHEHVNEMAFTKDRENALSFYYPWWYRMAELPCVESVGYVIKLN